METCPKCEASVMNLPCCFCAERQLDGFKAEVNRLNLQNRELIEACKRALPIIREAAVYADRDAALDIVLDVLRKYEKRIEPQQNDEWQTKYEHVLGLLRNTKMQHGTCQPRSRKACTACNSQEELDKIIKDWKGFTMVLS